ncbi:hypothetical protein N646_4564 [Vibrio alginolyticus NBRC 15630 = ATCC 17749]|uniref:Uncharacterized protein n=1 Tax=Vibrio alginolyticus (strain ATCC 17749 / DSM 2171 / NBRC 15630 / NCIMB 1903 / NCTC 12160 / XII-53) TaxID=1219076 RepID=A0A2I3CS67_VIBAX|nr:hypothetical protein N646_4564 [Vibrio alginolyticus NBRC 15630 = ATCC 17749]
MKILQRRIIKCPNEWNKMASSEREQMLTEIGIAAVLFCSEAA